MEAVRVRPSGPLSGTIKVSGATKNSGLKQLARGDAVAARASFNAVYGQIPGELAPKLALALACEESGEADLAETLYLICARTDANYTAPAAFGLSRIRVTRGDSAGAMQAMDLVPATSRLFVAARRQRAALLLGMGPGLDTLSQALDSVRTVTIEPRDRAELSVDVFQAALEGVRRHGARPEVRIGGYPAAEPALRDGLERAYRDLAALTDDREERVRLVDAANVTRRWTLR